MQIAAAVVGSVGATQVIRPAAEQAPMCRDPHCPSVGVPHFGPAICPPEHAEAWRYEFPEARACRHAGVDVQPGCPNSCDPSRPGSEPVKCGHDQIVFWSGVSWVHPMDMGVCDRAPV
jgi:hypothetical protein